MAAVDQVLVPAIKASDDKAASWPAAPAAAAASAPTEPEAPPEDASPQKEDPPPATAPAATVSQDEAVEGIAVTAIREFYAAYNRGELGTMADRFSQDAVYHDAIYLEPFFGRDAIAAYFAKFKDSSSSMAELKFVISDITGSGNQCGVAW